jgi:heme A synthase
MFGRGRKCAPVSATKPVKKAWKGKNSLWLAGVGLIAVGLLTVFLAVPFWLWAVLIGIVLILVGFFLIMGD